MLQPAALPLIHAAARAGRRALAVSVTVPAIAALAAAWQGNAPLPGSLLLFPEYDNRTAQNYLVTVTNTNDDAANGNVAVEFVYVARHSQQGPLDCHEFNRTEVLTPRDTLTVITNVHNPDVTRGYLYVFAKRPVTGQAISHNHLIGHSVAIDGLGALEYSLNPVAYRAIGAAGANTDADADGVRDLNGVEYEAAADRIDIPRFFGQDAGFEGPSIESDLILVALSGGTAFTTSVYFQIYNDNEETFSGTRTFFCWDRVPLTSISPVFRNDFLRDFTDHDPLEVNGAPAHETGWFWIDGIAATSETSTIVDPAFLAVLIERSGYQSASDLPFGLGTQTNGDLLPHSSFPDFP